MKRQFLNNLFLLLTQCGKTCLNRVQEIFKGMEVVPAFWCNTKRIIMKRDPAEVTARVSYWPNQSIEEVFQGINYVGFKNEIFFWFLAKPSGYHSCFIKILEFRSDVAKSSGTELNTHAVFGGET